MTVYIPASVIIRVHPDLSALIIAIREHGDCPIKDDEFSDFIEKVMPDLISIACEIRSYREPSRKMITHRDHLICAELRSWIYWCDGTVDLILLIDTEI